MSHSVNRERSFERNDELLFIGDHAAIDFINTVHIVNGVMTDTLHSDNDVRRWLVRSGLSYGACSGTLANGEVLRAARRLREIAVHGMDSRKARKKLPLTELNDFLSKAVSYSQLVAEGSRLKVKRSYLARTPEEFLAPVADAVADLVSNVDFDLVRQCAGQNCVLWFCDRTKSHHRRFCSAAVCGNRAKVAAYRARQQTTRR